jgi:hypothetical protein|tara:strand:+ start:1018 stop:1539 length:522 start_codon:yes stop_codon:yes gene_type:complete
MLTDREKTWKTAFKVMFALLEDWKNNDPDLCRRLPTRIFYEAVGNAKTGYTSKAAADNLSESTDDHFAMPQWLGRFVMDNGDVYLTDFQKFKEICIFAAQTIRVTKAENKKLSLQTSTIAEIDGINTFIETSVKDKYDEAGIVLWSNKEGYLDEFPLDIPEEILEYESQFLRS